MDRLIIGNLFTTEKFAEYALVSTPLPFTIFATAIVTVVRPYIIKNFNSNDLISVKKTWSSSIYFSAIITWVLGFTIMLVSSEIITLLYTKKYLEGLVVFNIYILYSMINITYFGMILSASGKSKYIFNYAIVTLVINVVFNIAFYWVFGYIGPAIASVISQLLINFLQLFHSSKLLKSKINEFFNFKVLFYYLITMIVIFLPLFIIKREFDKLFTLNEVFEILLFGGIYLFTLGILFYKKLKSLSTYLKNG
jgi:O-antigen/teichoic acid export membrane protein